MADHRTPDSRPPVDPIAVHPDAPNVMPHEPYSDPAADPQIARQPVPPRSNIGGLMAVGVIAVLLIIAVIAFGSGPGTDPATTAVIPDQQDQMVPTPSASPAIPSTEVEPSAPAPAE